MDATELAPFIEGGGTPDFVWTRCEQMQGLPFALLRQLVPEGRRLVVVAPHPDDEVLGVGGLMAAAAQEGRAVLVVAVTDGEMSHPDCDGAFLRRLRASERALALKRLGIAVTNVARLQIPDGGVSLHLRRLVDALRSILTYRDVVLVPWSHDGHPDHEATSEAAHAAAHRVGAPVIEFPVWGWHWAKPDDARFPWSRSVLFDMNEALRLRKSQALDAFTSQTRSLGMHAPILSEATLERFHRPYEVFFL